MIIVKYVTKMLNREKSQKISKSCKPLKNKAFQAKNRRKNHVLTFRNIFFEKNVI